MKKTIAVNYYRKKYFVVSTILLSFVVFVPFVFCGIELHLIAGIA
jgi:hypothetical protein